MAIQNVLEELDQLFSQHKIEEVERFLQYHIEESDSVYDQVTLLNELIGYYRDLSKYQESMNACQQVMELLNSSDLVGSIPYATTLQNVANALRAAGQLEASMMYYNQVYALYENQLNQSDMRYASLANNMSLLYQEMDDFENACICLEKALSIVMMHPEAIIEVATTHTNLAMSLLKLRQYESAMEHIDRALDIFEREEEKDFHYSGALAAMAEAKYMAGRLEDAVYYYQEAMKEIEGNVGKTQSYQILEQNLQMVCEQLGYVPSVIKQYRHGLDLCEDFYYEYGKPMIEGQFPEYADVIAVGLVGGGSDCFGFDDELSRDHDFGPGFCMWLTDAVYDEIGKALQEAYDVLPTVYMGVVRKNTPQAGKRVGVFRIRDFYQHLIGISDVPETNNQWLFVEDYQLSSATNGKVFRDDLGEFTRIRKGILTYYPEEVYVKKVAREAVDIARTSKFDF
ncbi:MAG: tetratricopeptide repeat protein [Eubacteriales bacterium]